MAPFTHLTEYHTLSDGQSIIIDENAIKPYHDWDLDSSQDTPLPSRQLPPHQTHSTTRNMLAAVGHHCHHPRMLAQRLLRGLKNIIRQPSKSRHPEPALSEPALSDLPPLTRHNLKLLQQQLTPHNLTPPPQIGRKRALLGELGRHILSHHVDRQ